MLHHRRNHACAGSSLPPGQDDARMVEGDLSADSLVVSRCRGCYVISNCRGEHAEGGVAALPVVEDREVLEDGVGQLEAGLPSVQVKQLDLHPA